MKEILKLIYELLYKPNAASLLIAEMQPMVHVKISFNMQGIVLAGGLITKGVTKKLLPIFVTKVMVRSNIN